MKKEAVLGIMLTLLSISTLTLTFNIQQVKASALELSDFTEDITSYLPETPNTVATISNGTIFMGDIRGNIYQSDDGGYTWATVFTDINKPGYFVHETFTDSRDNVYFWVFTDGHVWKWNSTTGQTYNVSASHTGIWHWGEQSNGSIYYNIYSNEDAKIYKSNDGGETFSPTIDWSDLFGWGPHHTHGVRVDPYTDDLYWFSGDVGTDIAIYRYDNGTNTWILESRGRTFYNQYGWCDLWICDMAFDEDYIYIGADTGHQQVQRIERGQNFTTHAQSVLRSDEWVGGTHFTRFMEYVDGIQLHNTADGAYWGSWDGEHWVSLWDNTATPGSGACWGLHRTVDGAIIVADQSTDQVMKFFIDASILQKIFYADFTTTTGDLVTVEQTVRNGTSFFDIGQYGITNANITLIGQAHENIISDGDMESGLVGGDGQWKERWGKISMTINATYVYQGTYSLNYTPHASWLSVLAPEFHVGSGYTPQYQNIKSRVYLISAWVKSLYGNWTDKWKFGVRIRNSTTEDSKTLTIPYFAPSNTTWTQIVQPFIVKEGYDQIHVTITASYAEGLGSLFVDNIQISCYESTVYEPGGMGKQYSTWQIYPWNLTHWETVDPSVTVEGETFSHSGVLTNGTSSSTSSIDLSTGIINYNTTVYGSGMVKVRIQGTRTLTLANAMIRNLVSTGLYNGTHYGTPTITTSENYIIMLADKKSSITQASLSTTLLVFTVSGYPGLSSVTRGYCGDKGEPTAVYATNGTLTRSYNASTKILTLNVVHNGPANILVDWRIPGDGNAGGISGGHQKKKK